MAAGRVCLQCSSLYIRGSAALADARMDRQTDRQTDVAYLRSVSMGRIYAFIIGKDRRLEWNGME